MLPQAVGIRPPQPSPPRPLTGGGAARVPTSTAKKRPKEHWPRHEKVSNPPPHGRGVSKTLTHPPPPPRRPPTQGYETREERSRRENRQVAQRWKDKSARFAASSAGDSPTAPGRFGPRGPELLMTMSFGEGQGARGGGGGALSPLGYDPESPTRALLQIPSPSGSPVPAEWGGSSDGSAGGGPPLHGMKVELSPKGKNERRKYPPYPEKVMTSKDIFGRSATGPRTDLTSPC